MAEELVYGLGIEAEHLIALEISGIPVAQLLPELYEKIQAWFPTEADSKVYDRILRPSQWKHLPYDNFYSPRENYLHLNYFYQISSVEELRVQRELWAGKLRTWEADQQTYEKLMSEISPLEHQRDSLLRTAGLEPDQLVKQLQLLSQGLEPLQKSKQELLEKYQELTELPYAYPAGQLLSSNVGKRLNRSWEELHFWEALFQKPEWEAYLKDLWVRDPRAHLIVTQFLLMRADQNPMMKIERTHLYAPFNGTGQLEYFEALELYTTEMANPLQIRGWEVRSSHPQLTFRASLEEIDHLIQEQVNQFRTFNYPIPVEKIRLVPPESIFGISSQIWPEPIRPYLKSLDYGSTTLTLLHPSNGILYKNFYTGSYHLNLSLPHLYAPPPPPEEHLPLFNRMYPPFVETHVNLMRALQYLEPLFLAIWSNSAAQTFGDHHRYLETSPRLISGKTTYFNFLMTDRITEELYQERAKKEPDAEPQLKGDLRQYPIDHPFQKALQRVISHHIFQQRIPSDDEEGEENEITDHWMPRDDQIIQGNEFRINTHYRYGPDRYFGFEFRMFDYFPTEILEEALYLILSLAEYLQLQDIWLERGYVSQINSLAGQYQGQVKVQRVAKAIFQLMKEGWNTPIGDDLWAGYLIPMKEALKFPSELFYPGMTCYQALNQINLYLRRFVQEKWNEAIYLPLMLSAPEIAHLQSPAFLIPKITNLNEISYERHLQRDHEIQEAIRELHQGHPLALLPEITPESGLENRTRIHRYVQEHLPSLMKELGEDETTSVHEDYLDLASWFEEQMVREARSHRVQVAGGLSWNVSQAYQRYQKAKRRYLELKKRINNSG